MKPKTRIRKTYTPTQKRNLVGKVITLVTKGVGITKARQRVARQYNTTSVSLQRWSKNITNNIVRDRKIAKDLIPQDSHPLPLTNHTSKVHVTGVDLHVPGKGTVKLDTELLTHISKLAGYTG